MQPPKLSLRSVSFRAFLSAGALLASAALASVADGQVARYRVELFPPPVEGHWSIPTGLNENGEIVGYSAVEQFDPLAVPVRVTAAGDWIPLAPPTDSGNFAASINENGVIVGGSGRQAYIWINETPALLEPAPGFFSESAADVNNAGVVVGSVGDSDFIGPRPAVWLDPSQPGMLLRPLQPNYFNGGCWAINESGQIAGTSGLLAGEFFAVRWDDPNSPVRIDPLPGGLNSEGLDLNEQGDVIGRSGFDDGRVEAMLYLADEFRSVGLGFLPGGGTYSIAYGVNDDRLVVGQAAAPGNTVHAFLWQDGAMHDLNELLHAPSPAIRYLINAVAINNSGQILADAIVGDGEFPPHNIALLTPIEEHAGDLDGDGDVDLTDLATLLSNYGCNSGGCPGDVDGDGDTDLADLAVLLSNFGAAP